MSDDRRVHGRNLSYYTDPWEVVRYERAGKWYLEADDGRRVRVSVGHAARIAADGDFFPGLPGGQAFDARVRKIRAAAVVK